MRRRTLAFVLLTILALVVAGVVWVAIIAIRWLSPAGESVAVPSLAGMPLEQAQAVASAAHLGLSVVARKPDFHASKGSVVGQLPAAGEHVREGRVVDVVLSDGQPQTQVPNVANMSIRDATVALENARLEVGSVASETNADVAEGTVLSQQPESLSQVAAGTKVDLVIARGRPVAYAPNFVGMAASAAPAAAKEAHVSLAPFVQLPLAPSAPPKGIVVAQDPAPGEVMGARQIITLRVSGGPIPTTPPSPSLAGPATPVAAAPGPSGGASPSNAPRGLRVSVALPQLDQPARVRVVLVDGAGSRTLYDQQTRGGFTLSFDLAVTGAGMLQTYVGDALVNSTAL